MKKARPSIGFERTEYTLKKGAKVEIMKIRGSSADADSHSIFSIFESLIHCLMAEVFDFAKIKVPALWWAIPTERLLSLPRLFLALSLDLLLSLLTYKARPSCSPFAVFCTAVSAICSLEHVSRLYFMTRFEP